MLASPRPLPVAGQRLLFCLFFITFFLVVVVVASHSLSTEESSTPGLDSLDLGQVDGCPSEAGRELGGVEEGARGGGDGAQFRARGAANARLSETDGLLEGAVLLGMVAVGAEGGVAGGGGRGPEALGELAGG